MNRNNLLPIYCLNFLRFNVLYWFYDFVYVEFITNCYKEALIILVLFSFYILSNSTFLDMVMSFHLLSTTYTIVYFPTSTNKEIEFWQFLTKISTRKILNLLPLVHISFNFQIFLSEIWTVQSFRLYVDIYNFSLVSQFYSGFSTIVESFCLLTRYLEDDK